MSKTETTTAMEKEVAFLREQLAQANGVIWSLVNRAGGQVHISYSDIEAWKKRGELIRDDAIGQASFSIRAKGRPANAR